MSGGEAKSRIPVVRQIEAALVEDIATGAVAPGARLDEAGLAARFGVSRTPVREALARLLAQGVLVEGEKRGVRVAEYSRDELGQIFEAMFEIEALCARLASQRLTLMDRVKIEAAQDTCLRVAETGDIAEYLRANEALHLAIYAATGNPFVAELAADFRRRTGPFRAKRFRETADLIASAESHKTLLASIFSASSSTADAGMRSHMTQSYLKVLAAET